MQQVESRKAEFIRMAAGSNTSYSEPDQFNSVQGYLQPADGFGLASDREQCIGSDVLVLKVRSASVRRESARRP